MNTITFFERQILESLNQGNLSISSIIQDTQMNQKLCISAINKLISEEVIIHTNNQLKLQFNHPKLKNLKIKDEIAHIIKICMQKNKNLKFKTIKMSQKEKVILQSMIYNLEKFLDSIEPKSNNTASTEVFFWGHNNYKELNNQLQEMYA